MYELAKIIQPSDAGYRRRKTDFAATESASKFLETQEPGEYVLLGEDRTLRPLGRVVAAMEVTSKATVKVKGVAP